MLTLINMAVNNWHSNLKEIKEIVLDEDKEIQFEQALLLTELPNHLVPKLIEIADQLRQRYSQNKVDLCSIINARSGKCAEDCKFCVQSSHYKTDSAVYPMKSVSEIVKAAKRAEEKGVHRFCIVTSGSQLNDKDFEVALQATRQIKEQTGLNRCASLGKLTHQRASQLKQAGLNRYHHNIETASSFFDQVCTTHNYMDKVKTINHLKEVSIEICAGGILNLGETPKQRIEFAFELKGLNPPSVPINFLNPRPGTPFAERPLIPAIEAVKYLAIFRLILPRTYIRLAGGRLETFDSEAELPFTSGVNALLIGDLLTTEGPETNSDIELLRSLGFDTDIRP